MLEHQVNGDVDRSASRAEGCENVVNMAVKQHSAYGHTGLEAANAVALTTGHSTSSPEENGVQIDTLGVAQNASRDLLATDMARNGAGHHGANKNQEASPAVESAAHIVDSGQAQNGSGPSVGDADQADGKDAGQAPGGGIDRSKHGSMEDPKGKEGDKGERTKSRSSKDGRRDSRRDRSKSKASKDKDKDKDKEKKRSGRGTHSRSRSHSRRRKHRSPSKLSPPRKRRARGSKSSSRSSSPSPRPRFSRGISPGAMPPRGRHFGGMRRSPPPFSRGGPPLAGGPWGYGGPPPYDPHGYGPPRGGYSPPRRWPGPGRSPPPYGYERPYGPYGGGPPPRGSRSPPPVQIYGRNPTTGSPLYGPPPAAQGGPWERALPVEPRPAAQGKVWGARSGWDSVAPEASAPDALAAARQVGRQSPVVPTRSAGAEVSGAPRQGVEEVAVPATSRSSRGPQLGDNSWQNGLETTSKPRPSEWSSASDGAAFAKPVSETLPGPTGTQQYRPSANAAEELRAMVHSVDHGDASWYYIDPQGKTQGPCTIRQFREWLRHMRGDPNLCEELKRFSDVSVWRVGMPFRVKLTVLMAIVVQTSPSPPQSPSPHDGKTFAQQISAR